ncbi:MAG: BrnT family toxin [Chloroflexi bacterium]|nr:BrnT family toxin [Chloroflexota bacterium]
MDLEWDAGKARRNARKHGITFEEATTVFLDPFELTVFDPDHSSQEDRYLSVGVSSPGRLLVVGYTERGGKIRIIFARRATMREQMDYEEA